MKIYKSIILAIAAATMPVMTMARELSSTTSEYGFAHPGILHTADDFTRIKRQLSENNPNVKAAYDVLIASEYSQSTVTSTPTATIVRGGTGENYITAARAATMAYQNALRWKLDGTTANADKAVEILHDWATTTTEITGDTNSALASGLYGYQFANAAELLRDYDGWSQTDFRVFQQWMLDVWYPACYDFLNQRNGSWENSNNPSKGERPGHYWSNWGLCNALTLMAIGILCDDVYIYNQGVSFYKYDQVGNFNTPYPTGYLTNRGCNEFIGNLVSKVYDDVRGPLGQLGQMQESGRDQGHALLALGLAVDICQVAWNQGDDLFSYMDNRLLAGVEYVAAYNFADNIVLPWTEYHYANRNTAWESADVQTQISAEGKGGSRPFWARVIGHYEGVKGLTLTYSEIALSEMGIDGGGKGSVSSGYDHPGYTVLTCTHDGVAAHAPTPLSPEITYRGTTIQKSELGGTTNTYSYQEPEIEGGQIITLKATLPDGETNTGNWRWDNGETTQEITFTANQACVRRVEYTNAYGVKSCQMFTIASLESDNTYTSGVNYTFANGRLPGSYTSSLGVAAVINGNLHVEMGIDKNSGKYRSDMKFDQYAGIKLNPSTDKYLAIKFNGLCPDGNVKFEYKDGSGSYRYDTSTKVEDANKNTICYFNLTSKANYTGNDNIDLTSLSIIIADNINVQNYSVDWVKTFSSVDDITAYKDTKDDGDDDFAVWNETSSTGYDNLLTAINAATASGNNCTLTVRQNIQMLGDRATISATELTIQGSDPRITVTRNDKSKMFFLCNKSSAKLTVKSLTLDGQNQTGSRMIEANESGGAVTVENVTFRNSCGNQTGAAIFEKSPTTVKDCKFINITSNVSGADKGVIFMGASKLTLSGNNKFDNCGINIFNEGNYDFTNSATTHTAPINITVDPTKKTIGGKVVGNSKDTWKYVINNDGYCLLYDGTNNHLYLAQGYAVNISNLGYATFYGDENLDLLIPTGVEAYTCKVNETYEYAAITKIEGVIPAGTAVLLYSETPRLYQFVKSETSALAISYNDLRGSTTDIQLNGSEADYYLLTSEGGTPVFKHVGAATTVTSMAHKAFIVIARQQNRAPALHIQVDSDPSGISSVTTTADHSEDAYNVSGQKVDDYYRGIVIEGGRKYYRR